MFKRIVKIVGIVLLGFVLLIGGVIAFMAIRGDFKKQVIKPTAVSFSIDQTSFVFDSTQIDDNGLSEKIYSFTISAQPENVTEIECTLKLENSNLIQFVKRVDGVWQDYNSNKFYLNQPIYFKLNKVTYQNVDDYDDGIVKITVKDKSGLLQDTIQLQIDRAITSISFVDQGTSEQARKNNTITNGLFGYENGKYDGVEIQNLDAIEGQDYPLQVAIAPLKAERPFSKTIEGDDVASKIYEIYYVEDGQPKLLVNYGEVVKLQTYDDKGAVKEEDCDFLKYDVENNNFVFNSSMSGNYEFKLATYPTYAIQDEILKQDLSFVERLNLGRTQETLETKIKMLTKTVNIKVSGTEVETLEFRGDESDITTKMLKDSQWVLNDFSSVDKYNLGLSLTKGSGGTEITGRYNELQFLGDEHFTNIIQWTLRKPKMVTIGDDGSKQSAIKVDSKGEPEYEDGKIVLEVYTDGFGQHKGKIAGLDSAFSNIEFDVKLTKSTTNYYLKLIYEEKNGESVTKKTTITFVLSADNETGKVLSLSSTNCATTTDGETSNGGNVIAVGEVEVLVQKPKAKTPTGEEPVNEPETMSGEEGAGDEDNKEDDTTDWETIDETTYYLDYQYGNWFVLGEKDKQSETYSYKTLKTGLYLALIGTVGEDTTLINNKFLTNIEHDGANTIITVKPIDSNVKNIKLYALVVNSNGTCEYTRDSRGVAVGVDYPVLETTNDGILDLPITIDESKLNYGEGFDVENLVFVKTEGSYNAILLFTPEYTLLNTKPDEWERGIPVYLYNQTTKTFSDEMVMSSSIDWDKDMYGTKNYYETIDIIRYTDTNNITYALVGYLENGEFVNKVKPTGTNYYSKLYPMVVKTEYLKDKGRVQTAEEVVNALLKGKTATSNLTNMEKQLTYDVSLIAGRKATLSGSEVYVKVSADYEQGKTYYVKEGSTFSKLQVNDEVKTNWDTNKTGYYEKKVLDLMKAEAVLGSVSEEDYNNINKNFQYYTYDEATKELTAITLVLEGGNPTNDFIANWGNYYIIIDNYVIASKEIDSEIVTIEAKIHTNNITLNKTVTFEIALSDYQTAVEGANVDIACAKWYSENTIKATSYYNFGSNLSIVLPSISFGGTYFENGNIDNDGNAEIIAGHTEIALNWEGKEETDEASINLIKNQTAEVQLSISHPNSEEILQALWLNLDSIKALEYNENNGFVGVVGDKIKINDWSIGYFKAGQTYSASTIYYINNEGIYEKASFDEEVTDGWWAENYENYYIRNINASFSIGDVLDLGHYIRLEWTYVNSNNTSVYTIYSKKLTVKSREVTGYSVNIADELFEVIKVASQPTEGDYYILKDDNTLEKATEFGEGTYYTVTKYTGNVYYKVVVGYNEDYTYTIYATNKNGSYLAYKEIVEETETIKLAIGSDEIAFGLKQGGGWINPEPFYAKVPEFEVQGNNYLTFDENNRINFAQVTPPTSTEFEEQGITVYLTNSTISKPIVVRIEQDGKFDYTGKATISSATTEANFNNVYTYGEDNDITDKLKITLDSYSVIRIGDDIGDEYKFTLLDNGFELVNRNDETDKIALNLNDKTWTATRTKLDNITLNLVVTNVLDSYDLKIEFTSPYKDLSKSTTNKTTTIYSGTTFIIGEDGGTGEGNKSNEVDALYNLLSTADEITIKYRAKGTTDWKNENISVVNGLTKLTVPDVNQITVYEFGLFYGDNLITTFSLNVAPNIIITTDISKPFELDDFRNNSYDLTNIKLKEYLTSNEYDVYPNYSDEDLTNFGDFSGTLDYKVSTFEDIECTEQVSNIAEISGTQLTINNPVSKVGTYYVKVNISTYATSIDLQVGDVMFKVTTTSSIKNANGNSVADIEIEAKKQSTFNIKESTSNLDYMFNLSRNSVTYYSNSTYIAGNSYKFVDGVYKLMTYDDNSGPYYHKEQNNVIYYEATEFVEGITYDANHNIVEESEWNTIDKFYHKLTLTDIFWLDTQNTNIEVTYNYANTTLVQTNNTLKYDNITYTLLGTSYYAQDNTRFDKATNSIERWNETTEKYNSKPTHKIGDNVYYYAENGYSYIYCKQNAYIFENDANLLVLSLESDGKTLYKFKKTVSKDVDFENATEDAGFYYNDTNNGVTSVGTGYNSAYLCLKDVKIATLGDLYSLGLLYTSFGNDNNSDELVDINNNFVDVINYNAQLVFNNGVKRVNIVTNDNYKINVLPYVTNSITSEETTVISGKSYTLYDESGSTADALFDVKADNNIKNITFASSGEYKIVTEGKKHSIVFNADGNEYESVVYVTLTYENNKKYTYGVTFVVKNSTIVNILYPYNVDKPTDPTDTNYEKLMTIYENFTAHVDEITTSVDNLFDAEDFKKWACQDNRFSYDIALKTDTINLTEDNFRNIVRYSTSTRTSANSFTVDENSKKLGAIELVAVSRTYASSINNVKESLAINGSVITISESLNLTGYVVFKVYADDTTAYGYYVLKIVDDELFDDAINYNEPRYTESISDTITDDTAILTLVNKHSTKINTIAHISSDLVDYDNYSNVYFFMVENNLFNSTEVNDDVSEIAQGHYIAHNKVIKPSNNIQKLTIAVVLKTDRSLVHICNLDIVLLPNIAVDENEDIISRESTTSYNYTLKNAWAYDYTTTNNNTKNLNSTTEYFKVTKDGNTQNLYSITLYEYSANLELSGDTTLLYKDTETEIIIIDNNAKTITLKKQLRDASWVKLKLTYGEDDGFVLYLNINLAGFDFKEKRNFEVGDEWDSENKVFNNTLDLSEVFGNYGGEYTFTDDNDLDTPTKSGTHPNRVLDFNNCLTTKMYPMNIEIILNDIVPIKTKTIRVEIYPNINPTYSTSGEGSSAVATPVVPTITTQKDTDTISVVGSSLYVDISPNKDVFSVKQSSDGDTYITINANISADKNKNNKIICFTFVDEDGVEITDYKYFVDSEDKEQSSIVLSASGKLKFVHSAINKPMTLKIEICTYSGDYYKLEKFDGTPNGETTYYTSKGEKITDEDYTGERYIATKVTKEPIVKDTYYKKVGENFELITKDYWFATSYKLYLQLPKTYSLEAIYRVEGAQYETVANNEILTLKKQDNKDKQDVDSHFFGTDSNGGTYNINSSRIAITLYKQDGSTATKYGYSNFAGLGLLSDNNPNKLVYTLDAGAGEDVSSILNGEITFRSAGQVPVNVLTLSNATTSLEYKFKVYNQTKDWGNVTPNYNLLMIGDEEGKKVNQIIVSHNQVASGVNIAYLQYLPTTEIEGQVGYVYCDSELLGYNAFVEKVGSSDYSSMVNIKLEGLDNSKTITKTIKIVTINGLSAEYNLVVSPLQVEYGYGEGYEIAYAGTQIGKLSDKDSSKNTRLTLNKYEYELISADDWDSVVEVYTRTGTAEPYIYTKVIKPTTYAEGHYSRVLEDISTSVTLDYIGAVNGHIDSFKFGSTPHYAPTDTSLVWWADTTNSDGDNKNNTGSILNGIISTRNVKQDTPVTLIFNVKEGKNVIGRVYYKVTLKNNIKIGINPNIDSESTIDLYLGSEIYTRVEAENKTVIDLLDSEKYELIKNQEEFDATNIVYARSGTAEPYIYTKVETKPTYEDNKYYKILNNNLYITLEKYSTGETLANNNALYNGDDSKLTASVINEHLSFDVVGEYGFSEGDVYTENGKIYIIGNPEGSFVLNVSSTNTTGYGESFAINLHKYDNTTARYQNDLNRGSGAGWTSGTEINLFRDVGEDDRSGNNNYAFESYREGYGVDGNKFLSIIKSGAKISYKVKTFDYGTDLSTIKTDAQWQDVTTSISIDGYEYTEITSNDDWNSIGDVYTKDGTTYTKPEEKPTSYAPNYYKLEFTGLHKFNLPSVKFSSASTEYQIVTIRLTIEYNGSTENHYYAHYLVYNNDNLEINDEYANNKTVKFNTQYSSNIEDKTWYKDGEIEWLVIMGAHGMYKWDETSSLVTNLSNYTYSLSGVDANGNEVEITLANPTIDNEVLKVKMSATKQFENSATLTLIIKDNVGGAPVLTEDWTFKATQTIDAKSSMRLDNFFLISEINNQDYYNIDIIGLAKSSEERNKALAESFLTDSSMITEAKWNNEYTINGNNTYTLYEIVYVGNSGSSVCKLNKSYFVLVGYEYVMKFNLNGGDYYINATIDGSMSGEVNVENYTTIWTYDGGFKQVDSPEITVSLVGADDSNTSDSNTSASGKMVTIKDIDTRTSNESVNVKVTYRDEESTETISRNIEIYFNIIINVEEYIGGNVPINTDVMEQIATTMTDVEKTELTSDDIDDNIALKKTLLSLIKYNGQAVSTDNNTLSYWSIEVVTKGSNYDITYTYNNGPATYTRKFTMTNAIQYNGTLTDNKMSNNDSVNTAMNEKEELLSTDIDKDNTFKTTLLSLILFKGDTIVTDDADTLAWWKISIVKDGDDYQIAYNYTKDTKTYSRTFVMAGPTV